MTECDVEQRAKEIAIDYLHRLGFNTLFEDKEIQLSDAVVRGADPNQLEKIVEEIRVGKKIGAIKELRRLVNSLDLKTAKEIIDKTMEDYSNLNMVDPSCLLWEINKVSKIRYFCPPYQIISNTQIINLISKCLEVREHLMITDPIDAVILWCENCKKNGGIVWLTEYVNQSIDTFVDLC